jgi:hypothetical protein
MLRVIRTELYFNPLEIKWQFPELIISNPGISAAFFRCDPKNFDLDKVISFTIFNTREGGTAREVGAFLDTALQNAPFPREHHLLEYRVLNVGPIEKVHNSEIIIEHSPPEGIPFHKLLSGASIVTVGTYVGVGALGSGGGPLLFLTVPAGILVVGAAAAIVLAFAKGLTYAMERAMRARDKTPPAGPTTTTTTPTTRTRKRRRT